MSDNFSNRVISAGKHSITVEYYQGGGGSAAQVDWKYLNPKMVWEGRYYRNPNLQGEPGFIRNDSEINFPWGNGSPGSGIDADNFSVRWQGSVHLPGGAWQFYTRSDDGSRVFVNGSQVLNHWWDHPAQSAYSSYRKLDLGTYNFTVDFYEHSGDASMYFAYWPRIFAEYWSGRDFTGTYKTAVLNSVDQNWGYGGPHNSIWQNGFSTRYTWPVLLRGGTYRICVDSDDGFRFYVDGALRFSRWQDSNWTSCQNIAIDAGRRTFRVDHYENGGGARVRVTWGRADGSAWYGVAQPSSVTPSLRGSIIQQSATDDVAQYFQLMHEHGTLGLGLEAEEQQLDNYQISLPLVTR